MELLCFTHEGLKFIEDATGDVYNFDYLDDKTTYPVAKVRSSVNGLYWFYLIGSASFK
jgi:hypothetical protein